MADNRNPNTSSSSHWSPLGEVREDVNDLKGRADTTDATVTSLSDKLKAATRHQDARIADQQARVQRLSTDVRTVNSVIDGLVATFGGRLDLVERALSALQQHAGSPGVARKSFLSVAREANVSDEDIRRTLVIGGEGELDLTDAQFVAELYTAFQSHVDCVRTRLDGVDTRLGQQDERIGNIARDTTTAISNVRTEVQTLRDGEVVPKWAIPVALAAWIVVGLIWGNTVHLKDTGTLKVGSATGTYSSVYTFLNSFWGAFCVGFLAFMAVLAVAAWIPSKRRARATASTSTTATTTVPNPAPAAAPVPSQDRSPSLWQEVRQGYHRGREQSRARRQQGQVHNAPPAPRTEQYPLTPADDPAVASRS